MPTPKHGDSWAKKTQSIETGLICPGSLTLGSLTSTRAEFGGERWYQFGAATGIWAIGAVNNPEARKMLNERRAQMLSDPDVSVEREQAVAIGECTLEAYIIHNLHGRFWIRLTDLYTPDAVHEFRARTNEDTLREQLRQNVQELLDLSLRTKNQEGVP